MPHCDEVIPSVFRPTNQSGSLSDHRTSQKSDDYLQSRLNAPEMEKELAGLLSANRAELDGRLAEPEGSAAAAAVAVDTKCVW